MMSSNVDKYSSFINFYFTIWPYNALNKPPIGAAAENGRLDSFVSAFVEHSDY